MIDRPAAANTDDYNIPQIQQKPVEPTHGQSVVDPIPNPVRAAPATPPPPQPLEIIKEGAELEAEEGMQESQQDGVDNIMIPVTENLAID